MNQFFFGQFFIILFALQSYLPPIGAERILVLAPICIQSHKISFMPFVESLAEKGHQVTVVTPYPPKKKIENVREIVMVDFLGQLQYNWFEMSRRNPIEALVSIVRDLRLVGTVGYKNLMENKEFRQIVDSREVDLLIIDAILNDFTIPFVDYFKVPFIYYSPSAIRVPWALKAMSMSQEYAYVPTGMNDFDSRMSFKERLINMLGCELFFPLRKYFLLEMLDDLAAKDFPGLRPIAEIERDAELLIINSHPTTAWSRPLPPNVVPIGAMHVRPAQPLPIDLQKIADEAQDGFIVFTLGSAIPVSSMPSNIVEMFVRVFARLPQRVFWKWEKINIQEKLSENVKIVDWLPQQDLLGHENARLFVTHGGLMGVQEAIYHGVPLLGLPFGNDQRGNLAMAQEEGYAIKLGWEELSESLLYDTIQKLINQQSFQANATRLSQLMQDEMIPAKEVAVYWIEHVLRHGGTKHLQSRAKEMPFYQLYLLDVWLFLSFVIFITFYVFYKIVRFVVNIFARRKMKTQ